MNSIFLPHLADIYKYTIVKKGLQEVREQKLVCRGAKCKVVQERAKWINGAYVLETATSTSIIFSRDECIEAGYEVTVCGKRYIVSDVQDRNFASGYEAGKRATCNSI